MKKPLLLFLLLLTANCFSAKASSVTYWLRYPPTCSTSSTINVTSCDTYNFNGNILTTSGVYIDTIPNYLSCDSVITLYLTINQSVTKSITDWICPGHTYNFNGTLINTPGFYQDTLANYLGCDSIILLTLNQSNGSVSYGLATPFICAGTSYYLNGQYLTTNGVYNDTLTNYLGCDSFLTVKLTVLPVDTHTITYHACGSPYYFDGQFLTVSGIYHDTLTNVWGCDSMVTLNYTYSNGTGSTSTIYDTICQNHYIIFYGQYIFNTGTYTAHTTNYVGCDSFITLYMTMIPGGYSNRTDSICQGVLTPVTVGIYTYNLIINSPVTYYLNCGVPNFRGCDSTIIVSFVLRPVPTVHGGKDTVICAGTACTLTASGCVTYAWSGGFANGATFYPTQAHDYVVTGYDAAGCSDKDTVHVGISNNPAAPVVTNNAGVLSTTSGGSLQWYFNNTLIPGATSNTYTTTGWGYYKVCVTNAAGCSACSNSIYIAGTGVDNLSENEFVKIFPSPFNNALYFELNMSGPTDNCELEIYNMLGEKIVKTSLNHSLELSTHSWPAGSYLSRITLNGKLKYSQTVVKQ